MIFLVRIILISLIIYLVMRIFARFNALMNDPGQEPGHDKGNHPDPGKKKISKETGEYIDYEDLGK